MEILLKYFQSLTAVQLEQLGRLHELYSFWNEQINVISRKDIDNLYLNHVLHSLSIAKLISFEDNTTILDVGTGGGFPGIPLAILFPLAKFHLIDSIGKKVKVAQNVADELNLTNVKCSQIRAEEVSDKYDFIVSRAVTGLPDFYKWVHRKVSPKSFNSIRNGILYLKGGDLSQEIRELPTKSVFSYPISAWYGEDYFSEKYVIHIPV